MKIETRSLAHTDMFDRNIDAFRFYIFQYIGYVIQGHVHYLRSPIFALHTYISVTDTIYRTHPI